ncbi:MAG: MarR family winged helix-turn-helix transcriptional regulator [Kiritimatiellia bacterium]|nr:MarR family transcriptional regulator [Lentisphaerota bacterium]
MQEFADTLVRLMPRLVQGLMHQERNHLARGLITVPQFWTLQHVATAGATCMHELAQRLGVKSSTFTSMADKMVRQGLVKRRSGADRRMVMLEVAAKGRAILDQIYREKRQAVKRLYAEVPASDRAVYLRVITQVVQNIDAAPLRPARPRHTANQPSKRHRQSRTDNTGPVHAATTQRPASGKTP